MLQQNKFDNKAWFMCIAIVIVMFFIYYNRMSSLENQINMLNSDIEAKNSIIYSLEDRVASCKETVELFRTKLSEMVEAGEFDDNAYYEIFPKTEAEITEEILSTKPLELDIETVILAYKNSSNNSLYDSYENKHIKLTGYVKNVTKKANYFYIDNKAMESFFGTRIEILDENLEGLKDKIEDLEVNDKIEVYGIGYTSGLTFTLKKCTDFNIIKD